MLVKQKYFATTKAEKFLSQYLVKVFNWLYPKKVNELDLKRFADEVEVDGLTRWQNHGFVAISLQNGRYYFEIRLDGKKWQMMVYSSADNHLVQAVGDDLEK